MCNVITHFFNSYLSFSVGLRAVQHDTDLQYDNVSPAKLSL